MGLLSRAFCAVAPCLNFENMAVAGIGQGEAVSHSEQTPPNFFERLVPAYCSGSSSSVQHALDPSN
jgi:hypothetical protein